MNNILDLLSVNSVSSLTSVLKHPRPDTPADDDVAEALDQRELQAEHAQAMTQDSPNVFLKAAMNIASLDFFTVLNRFDTVALSKRLEEKPELYFQMINSYANLMRANLEREKFEFKQKQAEAKQREREQELRSRKPILLSDKSLDHFSATLVSSRRPDEAEPDIVIAPQNSPLPPSSHSSTANTGDSELFDLSVPVAGNIEMPVAAPHLKTPDDHDDTWHEWTEEHPEDLVCCPS